MDNSKNNAYEPMIQKKFKKTGKSKLGSYMELFVGKKSFFALLKYELITSLFGNCPGAMGFFFRSIFYKFLFKKVGRGVIFGKSITIRNPYKITIGNGVLIDDNCLLDAKGIDNKGIILKDEVYIGRNSILSCKNGDIILNRNVNIGFNCEVYSLNRVEVGENTLIAAYTYLIGGGHTADDADTPFRDQEKHALGINIGSNVWLGAKSVIMDGCDIGNNSIVGAAAVVTKSIPEYSVAAGIPAKIIKSRK
jgi:acetyltransferase-like isoleucine patch superfamily enzyme